MMRQENLAYAKLQDSRGDRDEEWPEPETTELYTVLRRAALAIMGQIAGIKERNLADEIAGHALLSLAEFRGQSEFSTWFFTLARRDTLNWIRTRTRAKEVQLECVAEPEAPSHGDTLPLPAWLSPEDVEFISLRERGLTFVEIGEFYGITKQGAHDRWLTLAQKLRNYLQSS